jgi:drug/metabolite transporter (DMT)-like permease
LAAAPVHLARMELWVIVTIAAAAVQTLRFSLQKQLKVLGLSTAAATASRFVFAAPLAVAGTLALMALRGHALPDLSGVFWLAVAGGGLAQIIATFCTVALFSQRSFAVGIAFTKTEVLQVAIFSAVILGEHVTPAGMAAILVGLAGVLVLSRPAGGWAVRGFFNYATFLGVVAGGLFGVSAIAYRAATLQIANDDALFRAVFALAAVTIVQTLVMLPYLIWREPGEVGRVIAARRPAFWVGVTGMLGSLGWFLAFALQNAAYVRSVGQIELVFTVLVSTLVFRERTTRRELAGITLLALSIIGIVLTV